ncbi:MAG: hypothetical protein V2I32_02000 [Desulforhopalus sp.]|jgi:hypothetical protein|nr:hypothetical protein [Desulforhopalus sp.]
MTNEKKPQNCLCCRYYRLLNSDQGLCRVDKGLKSSYPVTVTTHSCPRWQHCGQHYFIRLGWLKAQSVKDNEGKAAEADCQ